MEVLMSEEFTFQITQKIGSIAETKTGWKIELNKVSWGGRPEKYDIRSWSPDHTKMGKGITMSVQDAQNLKKLLDSIELN